MTTINQVLDVLKNDPELDGVLREGLIFAVHRSRFSRRDKPVDQCACAARAFWKSDSAPKLRWLLQRKYGIVSRYRDAVLIRISELRTELAEGQNPNRL